MKRLAANFPQPFLDDRTVRPAMWTVNKPAPGSGFRFPKEYFFYTVAFENATPPPACRGLTIAGCAERFATLFDGFFVGQFGKYVVGEPVAWWDPTVYDDSDPNGSDPYRATNYYHPMSFTDLEHDLPVGPIYGDPARAAFWDPSSDPATGAFGPNPLPIAELCTRWDGSFDRMGRMVWNNVTGALDPTTLDQSQLLSECVFWPTAAGFSDPFTYSF